jgi:hypothetical protein
VGVCAMAAAAIASAAVKRIAARIFRMSKLLIR